MEDKQKKQINPHTGGINFFVEDKQKKQINPHTGGINFFVEDKQKKQINPHTGGINFFVEDKQKKQINPHTGGINFFAEDKQKKKEINSLVTGAARYAVCLKISCGQRPQTLRDWLCASITHIKNRNRNSPPQWFYSLNHSSSYFRFAFYSAKNSSFYRAVYKQVPRNKRTLDLSQWPNHFSIRIYSYYSELSEKHIWCYLCRWIRISLAALKILWVGLGSLILSLSTK